VLQPLVDQVKPLDDPEDLQAFRQFNARTELFGFMLHYDCRAGMADTGPYPLPDGRFAIVRDHFLNETAYPWSGVAEGLPYCVTQVMVFPSDKVTATVNEIQTTFTQPSNYLEFLEGGGVRPRHDADPNVGDPRPREGRDGHHHGRLQEGHDGDVPRPGAQVDGGEDPRRCHGLHPGVLLSHAAKVGLWDKFVGEGFDTLHPNAEAAWPVLTSSRAAEILTPVLCSARASRASRDR
jgi:hypothetical protein